MNSRRPSKPNLPSVPKPSKLLLHRGYAEPISSLTCRIPLIDHSIYQYEIGPFLTASQIPNGLLIETLQIPILSSSPLLNPWEVHFQNLFSP